MRHEDVGEVVMVCVSNYVCNPVLQLHIPPKNKRFDMKCEFQLEETVTFKLGFSHIDIVAKLQLVLCLLSVLALSVSSDFGTAACRGANNTQLMIYYRSTCLQQISSLT